MAKAVWNGQTLAESETFETVEALVAQMNRDVEEATRVLDSAGRGGP